MPDINYQPKFEEGETIMLDGRYTIILGVEDGEYYVSKKGRLRWMDASDIDSTATKPNALR